MGVAMTYGKCSIYRQVLKATGLGLLPGPLWSIVVCSGRKASYNRVSAATLRLRSSQQHLEVGERKI